MLIGFIVWIWFIRFHEGEHFITFAIPQSVVFKRSRKEYYQTDLSVAPTQNIQTESTADSKDDVNQDDTVADEEDEDEEEEEDKMLSKGAKAAGGKTPGKVKRKSAARWVVLHSVQRPL